MPRADRALRLRPDAHINVAYGDGSPAGSPVGDKPEQFVRELFAPVMRWIDEHGFEGLIQAAPDLLRDVALGPEFASFASCLPLDGDPVGGGWRVHDDVLYPDAALARPRQLTVAQIDRDRMVRAKLPIDRWPVMHDVIAQLDREEGLVPSDVKHADAHKFLEGLIGEGIVEPRQHMPAGARWSSPVLAEPGFTFVGHNTVVVRSATSSVVIDPLLFARREGWGEYQPLGARDLGPVDAIVITHSHRDHFDPASLLRFPRTTKLIVPAIERETVLAIDVARRLAELGFTDIVRLPWGKTHEVGDIAVHALPFYGEQPTDAEVLHPEVRNEGNTYLVRTPELSAVFLADAGRDGAGSMFDVALDVRRRIGAPDLVFVGYRGWITYPVQLLFSSVARYVWFVPPWLWASRLTLMLRPDEAVDLAERFCARFVVPYADGGAPWHWALGLGPRLDGTGEETEGFDVFPDRVLHAARTRVQLPNGSSGESGVVPLLVRPNDTVTAATLAEGNPVTVRVDGHSWPY